MSSQPTCPCDIAKTFSYW